MDNDDKNTYDHISILNKSCKNNTKVNINSHFYNRNYPKCITRLIKQRCKCEISCLRDFFKYINFDRECKFWDLEDQFEDDKYIYCGDDDIIRNLYTLPYNDKTADELKRIINYKYKTAVKLYNLNCKNSPFLENGLICAHDLVRSFCKGDLYCENEFQHNFPISFDCPQVVFESDYYFSGPNIYHGFVKEADDYLDEYSDEDDIVYDSGLEVNKSEKQPTEIYNYIMKPRIDKNLKQVNLTDKDNSLKVEKIILANATKLKENEKSKDVKIEHLKENQKKVILIDEVRSEEILETEKINLDQKDIKLKEDDLNRTDGGIIYEYEDSYSDYSSDFGEQFNDLDSNLENRLNFIDNRKKKEEKAEVSNLMFLGKSLERELLKNKSLERELLKNEYYPEIVKTNESNFTKEKDFSMATTFCDNQGLIAFGCVFFLILFIIANWLISKSRAKSSKITCLRIINLGGFIILMGVSIFFILCSRTFN